MHAQSISPQVRPKNILYATDFSGRSNAALPYAVSIARKYGSNVFVVHVVSSSPFQHSAPTIAWQSIEAQALRETRAAMEKLEPRLQGIPHETWIQRGDISEVLFQVVDEEQIDLIVLGTHGRLGVNKVLMGSVAEKIFREAPCPVLTVGPNVSGDPDMAVEMRTVLYPTDFSAESIAAIPYTISIAQEHQARLYLLHVSESLVDRETKDLLKKRMHSLIPGDAPLNFQPVACVHSGSASEEILSFAEELAVDLILLGVKRLPIFLGGSRHPATATACQVVSRAICPVLTVRG